jgi:ribosomal protein S18 acetylase RimI-like enzyme
VVGLLGIATIPAARRRGAGAAVTTAPLVEARARGFAAAVLYSTEMGLPLYRQLGFGELGCGISRYLWMPEAVGGH